MSNTPSLWKQLVGAAVGSAVAVAIYVGYTSLEPLRAYLVPPGYHSASSALSGTGVRLNTKEVVEREIRINARASQVAERLSAYRAGGHVVAVAPKKVSSQAASSVAMMVSSSSEKHRLPPAPAGAWLDEQWSSETTWPSSSWQTSSAAWVAAVTHSGGAKFANPDALPSSGAAGVLAVVAGLGGALGLATQRLRAATMKA